MSFSRSKIAFVLTLGFALALTFSCSSDDENDNGNSTLSSEAVSSSSYVALSSSSSSIGAESSSSSKMSSSSYSSSSSQKSSSSLDIPNSGHYANQLSFTIPPETEQGIIRCEKSGAEPNSNSQIVSGTALSLTETTVLRCAQFKNGIATEPSVMRTYIIGRLPDLPIVSIAVNPYDMFDKPQALYKSSFKPENDCGTGTFSSFYTDEQIPIYVDFFEKGANLAWSYPAGIKIHGGCSRMHPKKSVIISFKEEYGQKNLKYPLFPEYPNLTKFKHFMLRNNGNNYEYDYIRDMLMSSLTEGLGIDYQKGRAVVVYYNGQYYGIHNLRERANSDYIETNYSINEENVDFVKVDNGGEVSKGSDADYQSIVSWLNGASLASDENFKELEQRIDVDNFTNHFQSRIFYKDCDWPGKNMKRWRSPGGKWKWLLYDTDHGFGSWGSSYLQTNNITMMQLVTATNGPKWPNPPHSTLLLRKLLENQSYKNAFINRFSLLIATYFTTERINEKKNKLMAQISNERTYDEQRWSPKQEMFLPKTMDRFASDRPSEMQSEIQSFFNLSNPVNLTISVRGGGSVKVHNLPVPNGSATFKAYPGVPIELEAVGSGFKQWSDGVATPKRKVEVTEAKTLTAEF